MFGLVAALGLGVLIASSQLLATVQYYPTTIRPGMSYTEKVSSGNLSLNRFVLNLLSCRSTERVDGLHFPEGVCYIGLIPLGLIWFSHDKFWWIVFLLSLSLAMGKWGVLFRWTHWLHLRHPVRYCYFSSLALIFLAVSGPIIPLLVFLQAFDLLLNTSRLLPMEPYVQRWERPETTFTHPLAAFLSGKPGRVSGLPYPLRTGQLNHIKTLGYNGSSQPCWMQQVRQDDCPTGSGASDWFSLADDGELLDWYGVEWAYTYRALQGKWQQTAIPHLYKNTRLAEDIVPPTWKEVAWRYGANPVGTSRKSL